MQKLDLSSFERETLEKAKLQGKTIVLPEASRDERVRNAGLMALQDDIKIIMLADNDDFLEKYNIPKSDKLQVINYLTSSLRGRLAQVLYEKRKHKGLTLTEANRLLDRPEYFGTMLVECGVADGMVCGACTSTGDSLRPALQIIKGKDENSLISTFMIMETKEFGCNGKLLLSDISLNMNPSADDLVNITFDTANSARKFGIDVPKVALLSYSTLGSANGEVASKMREATAKIKSFKPDFVVDGEYQLDSAIVPEVARLKAKNGQIKGDSNVLIFPNLESGNITYKAMSRFGHIRAFGPICQGLNKPINDVSRGASDMEILITIAITCLM